MSVQNSPSTEIPIACDLSVFQPSQREEHESTVHQIFAAVTEVRQLPNGYAFRLPAESAMLGNLADFIASERLCCPFFGFGVELEPQSAALWLRLTGGEGVKEFLQQGGFGSLLNTQLAEAGGLS